MEVVHPRNKVVDNVSANVQLVQLSEIEGLTLAQAVRGFAPIVQRKGLAMAASSTAMSDMPVRLLPGRDRLLIKPVPDVPVATIGIVFVPSCAAATAG
jgi:hypothetical protein